MHAAQIKETVTNRIVEALKGGVRPWARPWSLDPNSGHPTSVATRKQYNGINPVLLDLTAIVKGYQSRWWATFEQWKGQGAYVKKGEKSTMAIFFKTGVKETRKADGTIEKDKYALMRHYALFNVDQVQGDEVDRFRPDHNATNDGALDYSAADTVIAATGAEIRHGGNRAAFMPSNKRIVMPYKSKFNTEEHYYSTCFHELSHWADDKLGTDLANRFGSDDYAFGELVAEMSACYLSSACAIPIGPRWDDSVSYLDTWIKKMNKDHTYIFKASTRASAACNYILNFSRTPEEIEADAETADA